MATTEPTRHQPRTATYLVVAAILTLLTLMEIGVYQLAAFRVILVPVLIVLMIAKFSLVCMFYMHLRFDDRFFTVVFTALLFFASAVIVSLVLLFHYHRAVHSHVV